MPIQLKDEANQIGKKSLFTVLQGKSLPEAIMLVLDMIANGMGRKEKKD